jgi:hypothetical protein
MSHRTSGPMALATHFAVFEITSALLWCCPYFTSIANMDIDAKAFNLRAVGLLFGMHGKIPYPRYDRVEN